MTGLDLFTVSTEDEAMQVAVDWQVLAAERDYSYQELAEWQRYFTKQAERYNLTEEFKENGII